MAVEAGQRDDLEFGGVVTAGDTPSELRCINVASDTTARVNVDDDGVARRSELSNVFDLDPAPAMFEAMLEGWANQQRARFLKDSTIVPRVRLVRRFAEFSDLYPWQWTPAEGEAWIASLRSGDSPRAMSTLRGYEVVLRVFCDYLTDRRYRWAAECENKFGAAPEQIFHEDNSILHASDYEGSSSRRPLTYDEVQALFDAADGIADQIAARHRKGVFPALRNAAMLKFAYAYGLRRQEIAMSDLVDLRRNGRIPEFGRFGAVSVRHGKSPRGGAPKRRTVLTVPQMSWVTDVLENYLDEVRPTLLKGRRSTALWVTERGTRISTRQVGEAFVAARKAANLDESLDLHCLRHSFVTHLVEFDYPERFIQEQVGHSFSSTTAIYVGVSNEYRNRLIDRAMTNRYGDTLTPGEAQS